MSSHLGKLSIKKKSAKVQINEIFTVPNQD